MKSDVKTTPNAVDSDFRWRAGTSKFVLPMSTPSRRLSQLEQRMIHESRRVYGRVKELPIDTLRQAFSRLPYVKLALLFGSRASVNGVQIHAQSDYDFAVLMDKSQDCDWGHLAKIRIDLGILLSLADEDFDVVDLQIAIPTLLNSIQSQYVVLKGDIDEFCCLFKQHD